MATFNLKPVTTVPLKIEIAIPGGARGHFIGNARVRSKADNKALVERYRDFQGEGDPDEGFVRELYDSFTGLGDADGNELTGDAAFEAVLKGPFSAFLTPAVVQAYFAQYGEARMGNSGNPRSR